MPSVNLARGMVNRLALMTAQQLLLGAGPKAVRVVVEELAECHQVLVQLPGVSSCPS